jgi:hypothetical protein
MNPELQLSIDRLAEGLAPALPYAPVALRALSPLELATLLCLLVRGGEAAAAADIADFEPIVARAREGRLYLSVGWAHPRAYRVDANGVVCST